MNRRELSARLADGPDHTALRGWARGVLTRAAEGTGVPAVHHPLGFVCLPVERTGGDGVCVHVWSPRLPEAATSTSGVHCHSWDLVSYVLTGEIGNRLPDVRPVARGPTHRLFEVVSSPAGDDLRPTGRTVRQGPGVTERHGPGAVYRLPAGVFHESVVPDGGCTATIALGSETPGVPDLTLGPLDGARHHVTRPECGDTTLRLVARAALDGL
ncbi:hypothetical protein [Actinomadura flavalba]|uniref:hypothetical protein n=1 Tax=Actinomadura flavalba TaxID=1120938 RepID=UPI000381FCBD|nr:hypothetical protein [Actinomadura flavalba]